MQRLICNLKQKAWEFDKVAWLPAGGGQRICWLSSYFPSEWNFYRLTSRTQPSCLRRPCFPNHLPWWLPWTLIALNYHESSIKMWPKERGRPLWGHREAQWGFADRFDFETVRSSSSLFCMKKRQVKEWEAGGRRVWGTAPGRRWVFGALCSQEDMFRHFLLKCIQ